VQQAIERHLPPEQYDVLKIAEASERKPINGLVGMARSKTPEEERRQIAQVTSADPSAIVCPPKKWQRTPESYFAGRFAAQVNARFCSAKCRQRVIVSAKQRVPPKTARREPTRVSQTSSFSSKSTNRMSKELRNASADEARAADDGLKERQCRRMKWRRRCL